MTALMPHGELGSEQIVGLMENNIELRADRYKELVGNRPALMIVSANPDHGPSTTYMGLKQRVGRRLGVAVEAYTFSSIYNMIDFIQVGNADPDMNGIIVQLPLQEDVAPLTDPVLEAVSLEKDVDGLVPGSPFIPATVRATEAWLAHYGYECIDEKVVLVGLGKLVGEPLLRSLLSRGAQAVQAFDKSSLPQDLSQALNKADVIVSATGHPGLLTRRPFLLDTAPKVLVDVGTAEQSGAQQGDVSDELREYALARGWALTPKKGGIGPLTVRALFANLMDAAETQVGITEPINAYRLNQSLQATSANRAPDLFTEEQDRFADPYAEEDSILG